MWFTKTSNGYNAWFAVVSSTGVLRAGLQSGSFLVTVRNHQDTDSYLPSVSESGKQGLYKFVVSSSFLQSYGTGAYGVVVEVAASLPTLNDVFTDVLQVYDSDFDSGVSAIDVNTIVSGSAEAVWNLTTQGHMLSGTFGNLLLTASQGPTPVIDTSAISNAVWSKDISAYAVGTAGHVLTGVSGSIVAVATDIAFIKSIEGGRWKIENNRMKFYKDDNITLVAEFDLFDSSGTPSESSVFERVRL